MSILDQLLAEQTKNICQQYKATESEVGAALRDALSQNAKLSELITNSTSLKDIYRTRLFKDFLKKTKKEIYYDLRTYKKAAPNLEESHISSRERAPYVDLLFAQIDGYLEQAETILDLGGGLFPVSFPFDRYPKLKNYVWVDRDKEASELLKKAGLPKLTRQNFALGENPWHYYLPDNRTDFDFVFMLKLVPVLYRQQREVLSHISKVPFRHALITGSKEAMVKKVDIEAREKKVIEKFIREAGWEIVKRIDLPNEFGYLVK